MILNQVSYTHKTLGNEKVLRAEVRGINYKIGYLVESGLWRSS